ncbi:uncharacterized protein Tco025E_05821 [Trypanosoma conorhini]|uniref:Uncharacterized protein n=1 Tax=Trypanosoma conorhini TaxID=83891 RepID=A0A422P9U2_9TRYP|nr:uncharacterized protein Tco025E_05821 [Trypanosoma conorhini]RNF14489.1 hypothetical protein Tco025E_05821 [Trypanosoma conorhini]
MPRSTFLGAKRAREEPSFCERPMAYRVTAPLRRRVPCVIERDAVAKSAGPSVPACAVCPTVDKGGPSFSGALGWPSHAALSPVESRPLGHRRNVCQLLTLSASPQDAGTASPAHGQVEVDVTRGDTGKHYCFTFHVPAPGPPSSAGKDKAINVAYRHAVLRALLNQVSLAAALAVDRAWVVVYHGKNVLSDAGAELLVSALLSKSHQRIPLALFYGVDSV